MLGMTVHVQNALFDYFSETLAAVILQAKRNGRWDMGILGEFRFGRIQTMEFLFNILQILNSGCAPRIMIFIAMGIGPDFPGL